MFRISLAFMLLVPGMAMAQIAPSDLDAQVNAASTQVMRIMSSMGATISQQQTEITKLQAEIKATQADLAKQAAAKSTPQTPSATPPVQETK